MRYGDFAALTGIAAGATAAIALTVALAQWLPTRSAPPTSLGPEAVWIRVAPESSIDAHRRLEGEGAFGFRPPLDFAVIRRHGRVMSGPESPATGWHRPPGDAPPAPDPR